MMSLKERRQELGLTLEEVGKIVGVGKSTVRKWETGYIENMGRDKIVKYSRALKISPMEILDPDNTFTNDTVEMITEKAKELTPSRQQNVYNYADKQLKEQQSGNVVDMPTPDDNKVELQANGVLSAGVGEFLDDSTEMFPVMVSKPIPDSFDYVFKVNGRSMEPTFEDGQVIFVTEREEYRNGQIIAVIVDNCAYVKRLKYNDDSMTLISLNPDYPNVQVLEDDEYRILGVAFA